jgi:hypothetical protein
VKAFRTATMTNMIVGIFTEPYFSRKAGSYLWDARAQRPSPPLRCG